MKINSIRFQITLLYVVITGAILLAFSTILYVILSSTLYRGLDYELRVKSHQVRSSIISYTGIFKEQPNALQDAVDKVIVQEGKNLRKWWILGAERRWIDRVDKLRIDEAYINFLGPDGKSLAHSPNVGEDLLARFMDNAEFPPEDDMAFHDVVFGGQMVRVINDAFHLRGQRYMLQVGISPQPIAQLLEGWLYSLIWAIPLILLLTVFIGNLFTDRILAPVRTLTAAAQHITHEELQERVPIESYAIEMQDLVTAFNDMISRLEKSFEHIEEFSSNAAHELKTPLTIIKGELELALMGERSEEEFRRAIDTALEEVETILQTIDHLLYLSKLDYEPEFFHFVLLNLEPFLKEIVGQSRILAKRHNIRVQLHLPMEELSLPADPLHLRRMLLNLVDNAIKFTPEGGTISINVERRENEAVIAVRDTGTGIHRDHLERIFDRFFRADQRKAGIGLGLSMVQSIVRIHKGRIEVESEPGQGTVFFIYLPLV